jgi:UDP-arabinose 4-epimerase
MAKILVTGGAGYIGSHVCKALAQRGHVPVTYDNLVNGHDWAVRWGPLEVGDIADRPALESVVARHAPEAVIHLAAYAYVGESVVDPGKYYRNNVAGSLTLLEVLRDRGVGRLIFSSTCAVYGIPEATPIEEDAQLAPINPYGASKRMIEQMLADFHVAHGLDSVSLRYFNAAGADPDAEIGEAHDPETHLIPLVLDAAQGARSHVTVYGDDYDTPDGTCIRDYIHVSDLAEAHLLALDWIQGRTGAHAFNLGNGRGFSVQEVIDSVRRVTGRPVTAEVGPRRPGDPPRLVGSADRARRALGWTPNHDELDAIVETAWRWHHHALAA